jgi:hypothetical protein
MLIEIRSQKFRTGLVSFHSGLVLLAPHARIEADQHAEAQVRQFYFVGLPQKRGIRLERHRRPKLEISSARVHHIRLA